MGIGARLRSLIPRRRTAAVVGTSPEVSGPLWFQIGGTTPRGFESLRTAAVYGCQSILAQEVSRHRIEHRRKMRSGGYEVVRDSGRARLLDNPNEYQNGVEFRSSTMTSLLTHGNAYSFAVRDKLGRVRELHPLSPHNVTARVVESTGDVFYDVTTSDLLGTEGLVVPARNIWHMRMLTPYHPLCGMAPIEAATSQIALGQELPTQQLNFFRRAARPSGVLSTPKPMSKEQAERFRDDFQKKTSAEQAGALIFAPVDVKFTQFAMTAAEAQLAEQYELTVADVCRIYRVPFHMMLPEAERGWNTVESLQRAFVAGGLGWYFAAWSASLNSFLRLKAGQSMDFDVESGMVRTETKDRIESATKAIQGALYTPNEARDKYEGLPRIPAGDTLYLQRQMTPIKLLKDPPPPPTPPPAAPAPTEAPPDGGDASAREILAAAWEGTWSPTIAYDRGSLVMWKGSSWINQSAAVGDEPGASGWSLFAQRGSRRGGQR